MLDKEKFEELCKLTGWTPRIDMCADELGGNSVTDLYYAVDADSLL
jgi:hypothetical protein